jgi:hypothetical protein
MPAPEGLHAQLSPSAQAAPRWFHEGVAEAFAPRAPLERIWNRMLSQRTWIPFSSVVGDFAEFEASEDAQLVYAQSRAMVELLRNCGGDAALGQARLDFVAGLDTAAVLALACHRQVTGPELLKFLERWRAKKP